MNLRHTAALALVGWYLMAPPHIHRNGQVLVGVDKSAPLDGWEISASFDTADECQSELRKEIQEALKFRKTCEGMDGHPAIPSQMQGATFNRLATCFGMAGWESSHCIASNDPRLKPK